MLAAGPLHHLAITTRLTLRAPCCARRYARPKAPKPGETWDLDEVFIRINGVLHYLWRAVDQHGVVLDILVRVPSSDTAHVIDVCRYGQIQLTSWDNALDLGRPGHCLIIADQDDGLMPPRTVAAISVGYCEPPWCMNRLPVAAPSGFGIKRSGRRLACRALSSD
jgi:DDE domain